MRKVLLIVMAVLLVGACTPKEVKVQSEDSRSAEEAFALAEDMRKAYVGKDFKALERYATEDGFKDLKKHLRDFERVELKFTSRWVDIEGGELTLNVAWKGTWTIMGREREDRGMAVFQLTGSPLRLNRILRSSPFRNPD
jgi:hypothetical protein